METSIKQQVEELLTSNTNARDNCFLLYTEILALHYSYNTDISLKQFFLLQVNKNIPNFEYVCRLSRRIQSINMDLRGSNWTKRQNMQITYRNDLGYGNQ